MPEFTVPGVFSIVEHRGRPGLEQLEADWKRLYAAMPERRRYHAYEAQLAYLDNLCAAPERARFLALVDGEGAASGAAFGAARDTGAASGGAASGTVRAICPLEATTDPSLPMRLRAWALPSHDHWLATDVLAADDEARQALLPAVTAYLRRHRQGRSLLLLGPVQAGASGPPDGPRPLLAPSASCLHDTHPSAFFDCTVPYEQLQDRMSGHFRRNLRNHRAKLAAAGEVRLVTVSGAAARPPGASAPAALAAEFDHFLEIEASGWKGSAGASSAIRLRPHVAAFYRDLLTTFTGPDDHCEINTLYLGGRCIAAQFCSRAGAEYTILKIAYDEEFARLGPGQFLFQATLERCCASPAIEFIDLVTDAPWMRDWQTELLPMAKTHVAIAPFWGPLLVALLRFRHGPARRMVWKYRAGQADRTARRTRAGREPRGARKLPKT